MRTHSEIIHAQPIEPGLKVQGQVPQWAALLSDPCRKTKICCLPRSVVLNVLNKLQCATVLVKVILQTVRLFLDYDNQNILVATILFKELKKVHRQFCSAIFPIKTALN